MTKLTKQIAALLGTALYFAAFNFTVYENLTKRCHDQTSAEMQAKSVEVSEYLPFDAESKIAAVDSAVKLSDKPPVIDGAAGLFPVYSAFVHAVYPESSVHYDGERFTQESAMQYTNTRGAYQAIAEGTIDIAVCVKPSDAQLAYAKEQGADLDFIPLGYDAFVFLVNGSNPVENLSCQQVRDIYAGKLHTWSQVGGKHLPIDAKQRNPGSGSQSAMESFMDGQDMHANPFGFLGSAIGYSFRYYVSDLVGNGGVKMLSLDGVSPTPAHIADGSYPVVSSFFAVYDRHNTHPDLPVLLEWMQSDEAQKIIADTGFIPLHPQQ